MPTIERGDVHVFVYRTGLLSAVGHDLRLSVGEFTIDYGDQEVEAVFDPSTFRVDGAVRDGELRPDALSDSDRSKIIENVEEDVLEVDQHDRIAFEGSYEREDAGDGRVRGSLRLAGVRRELAVEVRHARGRFRADCELTPSRWGIEPYSALLGALKLRDYAEIQIDVPDGDPS